MGSATLVRDQSPRPTGVDEARLIVSWQHPEVRAFEPIGVLSYDGKTYRFEYLERARKLDGFYPLLGFPEIGDLYESSDLFPLFAQRAMDPRRPDFERYIGELSLDSDSTPWEQITRSGGVREGDTLQLFPVPRFVDGVWRCYFLTSGVRYMMAKSVVVAGEQRGHYSEDELEGLLGVLKHGDELAIEPEPDNEWSEFALLVTTEDRHPLGYVPHLLVEAIGQPHRDGLVRVSVEQVNPSEAGWHMRLLVELNAKVEEQFEFFSEVHWPKA
jgi:hypothetical protein